jgi:phosphate-selective porin OprO and OprP
MSAEIPSLRSSLASSYPRAYLGTARGIAWLAGLVLVLWAGRGRAEDPPTTTDLQERLQKLEREHQALREQFDKLQAEKKKDDEQRKEEKQDAKKEEELKKEGELFEVGKDRHMRATWDNGLQFHTADEAFRFHVGGRLDFDNTWYAGGRGLPFELDDGSAIRRLRLRADGQLWETIEFVTEVNFANIQDVSNEETDVQIGSVGLTDVYLQFREVPVLGNVRVGHFKEPIGLSHLTSANYDMFMEREPAFDAFINPFDYASGVMFFDSYLDDRLTFAWSLAQSDKQRINPFGFGSFPTGDYSVTARLTGLPVYEDDGRMLVHLGVAATHRAGGPLGQALRTADRPLVRAGAGPSSVPNIMQTGTTFIDDGVNEVGVEFGSVFDRFTLTSEWAMLQVPSAFGAFNNGQLSDPRGSVVYQGVYVEAGCFLTPGDYRRYNRKMGVWDRWRPQENAFVVRDELGGWRCGRGALLLTCRYSFLDLVGGNPALSSTSGVPAGREHDVTVGLNWYLNSQTSIMVNYVFTQLDYVNGTGGHFHGLGCRFHVDF